MADSSILAEPTRERRKHTRRPVLWHARLEAGDYAFDCGVLNMSLSGARLRLALPLKRGAEVILVARNWRLPAHVVWHKGDQLGLKFALTPEQIRARLGEDTVESLQLDR